MTSKTRFLINIGSVHAQWTQYRVERGITNEEFARLLLQDWIPSSISEDCDPYVTGRKKQSSSTEISSDDSSLRRSTKNYSCEPLRVSFLKPNPASAIPVKEVFHSLSSTDDSLVSEAGTPSARPNKRKCEDTDFMHPINASTPKSYTPRNILSPVQTNTSLKQDEQAWQPTKNSRICSEHFVGQKSEHPRHPAFVPTIKLMPELNSDKEYGKKPGLERISSVEVKFTDNSLSVGVQTDDFAALQVNIGIHFERWTAERTKLQLSNQNFAGFLLDLLELPMLKPNPSPTSKLSIQPVSTAKNLPASLKDSSFKPLAQGLKLSSALQASNVSLQLSQLQRPGNDNVQRIIIRTRTAQNGKPYFLQKCVSTVSNNTPASTTVTPAPISVSLHPRLKSPATQTATSFIVRADNMRIAQTVTKQSLDGKIVICNKSDTMPVSNNILGAFKLPPNVMFNMNTSSPKKLSGDCVKSLSPGNVNGNILGKLVLPSNENSEETNKTWETTPKEVPASLQEISHEIILPESLSSSKDQLNWIKEEIIDSIDDESLVSQLPVMAEMEISVESEEATAKDIKTEPPDFSKETLHIDEGSMFSQLPVMPKMEISVEGEEVTEKDIKTEPPD